MTKVCHITNVHPQRDIRIFEKECVSLADFGYEVHLVAPGASCDIKNVQIHGIGERPTSRKTRMTKYAKKAYEEALKIDADIYHFHDPELILYGLKLKQKKKKVIFDSHENILDQFVEKDYIPKWIRVVLNFAFVKCLKYSCRKFDAIVTVDPCICQKYSLLNENSVIISNYPLIEKIDGVEMQGKYICFAGGISSQWNHEVIINAIDKIDGFKYVLCGKADELYLEHLKRLPGWKNVDYRGVVDHNEALRLLRGGIAGIALCSPSRNTNGKNGTIGNTKLFEIMMCGLPVICTNFTSWNEIVKTYDCGYCIEYNNVEQLYLVLRKIIDNPEKARTMGINGNNAILKKYNWNIEAKKLSELYKKLS